MAAVPVFHSALAALHGGVADFSWTRWELHASILIGCGLLLAGYAALLGPLRRRYALGPPAGDAKPLYFVSAVLLIFLSLNGPLHDLSDNYLFSAHMIQHMLLMLIMPPLLLLGLPDWLLKPLLRHRPVRLAARIITNPLVAFVIYNAVFAVWHFPQFYNWALVDHDVHIMQHLMFMAAATIMWWPVVDPVPELTRINTPMRLVYLFALGIPMSIVSAIITLNSQVMYPFYEAAPRVFPSLSAIDDQQLGGLIMWVPGGIIFWTAITIIFLRWARREERDEWQERDLIDAARAG
jgi:putative membrane protein